MFKRKTEKASAIGVGGHRGSGKDHWVSWLQIERVGSRLVGREGVEAK